MVLFFLGDSHLVEAVQRGVRLELVENLDEVNLGGVVCQVNLELLHFHLCGFRAQVLPDVAKVVFKVELSCVEVLHFGEHLPDLFCDVHVGRFTLFICLHSRFKLAELIFASETSLDLLDALLRQLLSVDKFSEIVEHELRIQKLKLTLFLLLCHVDERLDTTASIGAEAVATNSLLDQADFCDCCQRLDITVKFEYLLPEGDHFLLDFFHAGAQLLLVELGGRSLVSGHLDGLIGAHLCLLELRVAN